MDQQDAPKHQRWPQPLRTALLVCLVLASLVFLIVSYAALGWLLIHLLRYGIAVLRAAWNMFWSADVPRPHRM